MKKKNIIELILLVVCTLSCTNLDETVYDQVLSANYYNTRQDVINSVFRPFEHVFESVQSSFKAQEESADQFITPTRGTWYQDGGKWERWHRHQWDNLNEGGSNWSQSWNAMYTGIGQSNLVLDNLEKLDRNKFGITEEEWNHFKGQDRAIRAYCYLNLLDLFRNCILVTTSDQAEASKPENMKQVPPEKLFSFIESELLQCLDFLEVKEGQNGNGIMQGQFTKGVAAAMLVRLYLNAEVWIGVPKYDECIAMCKRLENGEFGYYEIDPNWYAPFDWNNETCNEVIFAFPAAYGYTNWHTNNDKGARTIYGRSMPYGSQYYLDIVGGGSRNPMFALSPSYDNQSPRQLFKYELGMVTQKFEKYAGTPENSIDLRYRQYVNLSANSRAGMFFLEGYIPGNDGVNAKEPYNSYTLYLLDQVGHFEGGAPTGTITAGSSRESTMGNGDFNSGLYCMKYPFYSFKGGYYCASDCTVYRFAEVIYSHAECLLRQGKAEDAGTLLNSVRKRNYTEFGGNIAYQPEGNVVLDMKEMLDEWGREFIMEGRRRMDLVRFGRFGEEWWDKPADADDHCNIYPLTRGALEQNTYLVQNPGYPTIR